MWVRSMRLLLMRRGEVEELLEKLRQKGLFKVVQEQ